MEQIDSIDYIMSHIARRVVNTRDKQALNNN